jgi:hypothetical protein
VSDRLPRRYQFDNHQPVPREPAPLPISWNGEKAWSEQPQQVIHVHQAPPDHTVQRLALGAGMGGGAVAAGVYFGPLLVATLTSMAISLAVLGLVIAVIAWAIVTVVNAVSGGRKGGRRG